jgi:hypothetical protein
MFPSHKVADANRQRHDAWRRQYTCPSHIPHSRHSVCSLPVYFPAHSALKTVLQILSLLIVGAPLLTSQMQPVHLTVLQHSTFVCLRFADLPYRFWPNAAGSMSTEEPKWRLGSVRSELARYGNKCQFSQVWFVRDSEFVAFCLFGPTGDILQAAGRIYFM